MKLATIDALDGRRVGALLEGDEILDLKSSAGVIPLSSWVPDDIAEIIAGGDEGLALVRRIIESIDSDAALQERLREAGALLPRSSVRLAAPLPRPAIIICAGQTFREHVREMAKRRGIDNPDMPATPRGFLKNANAVIGPDEPIVIPGHFPDKVDFEGEFALVLGRSCHRIEPEEAMDYVAGYTIVNDVSARDWASGKGTRDENLLGKQFPTFCPVGPVFATKDEIPDPSTAHLTTRLNGELMQSSGMDDLIFSIPEIIAHYARFYRLAPGDIITTGTPSGAGHSRKPSVYMKAGDVIEVEVPGVGRLRNPVLSALTNSESRPMKAIAPSVI